MHLLTAAGGNPLFAEDYVRMVRGRHLVRVSPRAVAPDTQILSGTTRFCRSPPPRRAARRPDIDVEQLPPPQGPS